MWVTFEASLERCHADIPSYLIIPSEVVKTISPQKTFIVEAEIGEFDLGRRSIKPWGDGRWFMGLTQQHQKKLQASLGDKLSVTIIPTVQTPKSLISAIHAENLMKVWNGLTDAQRRGFSEEVFGAKKQQTKARRIDGVINCLRGNH